MEGIRTALMDLCQPYDENLDHLRISTFLSEYKEDLIADSFTLDNVQKKKEYLLAKWREQSSQQLQELTRDSQKLDEKIRLYPQFRSTFSCDMILCVEESFCLYM